MVSRASFGHAFVAREVIASTLASDGGGHFEKIFSGVSSDVIQHFVLITLHIDQRNSRIASAEASSVQYVALNDTLFAVFFNINHFSRDTRSNGIEHDSVTNTNVIAAVVIRRPNVNTLACSFVSAASVGDSAVLDPVVMTVLLYVNGFETDVVDADVAELAVLRTFDNGTFQPVFHCYSNDVNVS